MLWFFVTYVVRFCVNVLIEPQINPIKHFPVVTVSHKLLLAAYSAVRRRACNARMETRLACTVATLIIWCIPGIFGFLVWELKENWRLYAANRSPSRCGRSSSARTARPWAGCCGRASIPARCRSASPNSAAPNAAGRNGSWHRSVRKHLQALHHVELDAAPLRRARVSRPVGRVSRLERPPPTLARLELTTNRIQIALECPPLDAAAMEIAFEYKSGWMLTDTPEPGWSVRLSDAQRRVFAVALNGFYKLAAVELLRPTIEAQFPSPMPPYDVVADRLVVWSDANLTRLASYPLRTPGPLRPSLASGSAAACRRAGATAWWPAPDASSRGWSTSASARSSWSS